MLISCNEKKDKAVKKLTVKHLVSKFPLSSLTSFDVDDVPARVHKTRYYIDSTTYDKLFGNINEIMGAGAKYDSSFFLSVEKPRKLYQPLTFLINDEDVYGYTIFWVSFNHSLEPIDKHMMSYDGGDAGDDWKGYSHFINDSILEQYDMYYSGGEGAIEGNADYDEKRDSTISKWLFSYDGHIRKISEKKYHSTQRIYIDTTKTK